MRTIISGAAAVCIAFGGVYAFADAGEITNISIDPDTQYITVSGKIDSENSRDRVTLRITKDGEQPNDGNVIHVYQENTSSDGTFSFSFAMPENTDGGMYRAFINSDNDANSDLNFRYFGDVAAILKNKINGASSANELRSFFDSNSYEGLDMFGIDKTVYQSLSDNAKNLTASAVYAAKNNMSGFETGKLFRDVFTQSALIAKIMDVSDSEGAEIMSQKLDILTVNYAKSKGSEYEKYVTAYESSKGITASVINKVKNTSPKGAESFWETYNNQVVSQIISKTSYWTEVSEFIDNNKELLNANGNVSWSRYSSAKQSTCKSLVGKSYSTINDFINAINTASSGSSNGNNSSGSTSGGGGGGNSGTSSPSRVILPTVDTSGNQNSQTHIDNSTVTRNGELADIDRLPWAADAIRYLSTNKIINGYDDNSFRPENTVTRAEFVAIIMRAFYGNTEPTDYDYADVAKDSWAYGYIATAANLKLVSGVGEGNFAPNDNIKRQDMSLIIYNILKSQGNVPANIEKYTFADDAEISNYASEAVYTLRAMGIINGDDNNKFNPNSPATRAEAAVMLYNLMNR